MAIADKEHKNLHKVKSRPIMNLLIGLSFFTLILLISMLFASKGQSGQGGLKEENSRETDSTAQTKDNSILAVVKEVDLQNRVIKLFDVNTQQLLELSYTGGTNITDKYKTVIAMSQIDIGSMVDAVYQKDTNSLTDMNISNKAWEYDNVSNLSIDHNSKIMKIASTKYKYNDSILVLDGDTFIPVEKLAEQDELTVHGYEETIWSITVTKGHGTVILENYENYLGDSITVGYESIQQITEGMEITVREGKFNLTVENGDYNATKNITVYRNKVTYVSLGDLGPDSMQHGRITFEITPFGADLYIDGVLTSYANPIELDYGKHSIKASLGGYTTYTGTLNLKNAGKTIHIDLPESSIHGTATVTETNENSGASVNQGSTAPSGQSTNTETGSLESGSDLSSSGGNTDKGHKIYVQEPAGASVYIDGEYKCTSPGSFQKITGSHVLTFIKDGYKTMSYTIEVADDGKDSYYSFPNLEAN